MSEEDVNLVVDFTNHVLGSSGLDLKAAADHAEDGLKIQVCGEDVALLLGHNAELLDALEYLGNRVLARASGEETRLIFDSLGYRARREKELRLMAEKAAEKVRLSRIPFSFDPMIPNERRIIHLALSNGSQHGKEFRARSRCSCWISNSRVVFDYSRERDLRLPEALGRLKNTFDVASGPSSRHRRVGPDSLHTIARGITSERSAPRRF